MSTFEPSNFLLSCRLCWTLVTIILLSRIIDLIINITTVIRKNPRLIWQMFDKYQRKLLKVNGSLLDKKQLRVEIAINIKINCESLQILAQIQVNPRWIFIGTSHGAINTSKVFLNSELKTLRGTNISRRMKVSPSVLETDSIAVKTFRRAEREGWTEHSEIRRTRTKGWLVTLPEESHRDDKKQARGRSKSAR